MLLRWPNTALVQLTQTNCKTLSQMSNIKKSHILLRAHISYKSSGRFCLMKGLTEQSLDQRASFPPGVLQPGYIRVSAPKNSLCFQTCNGSVEHAGLHVSPRAGPGTKLTITWDRTPVLATSVNVTAPFLGPPKGTGMLKVGFSTTGFRIKPWFWEFRQMKTGPRSPCSTGSHPLSLAHSHFLSFPHSQKPPCRLLETPREDRFLLSSLRPGSTGCLLPFWSVPPSSSRLSLCCFSFQRSPLAHHPHSCSQEGATPVLPEGTTWPQNSSQETTFLPAAQKQDFEKGIRHSKSVYKDSTGLELLPPFVAHYLACSRHSAPGLNEKGPCVLNAAQTLDGGQAWSWKPYLNRQDKRRLVIRRVSNTVGITVHLVKGFQIGTFGCTLKCKKREKKVLSVCVCIYRYLYIFNFFIFISVKGMPGHVAEQLKLYIFLKSSLFVAFYEHITK